MPNPIRVLFVCTGNSARSIMAETLLRQRGGEAFEVHSAGTDPRGINPLTLRVLGEAGLPVEGLRSKSVTEFLDEPWDYVITVCDDANERCPFLPGSVKRLHWSLEDPSRAPGDEDARLAAFRRIRGEIEARLSEWLASR